VVGSAVVGAGAGMASSRVAVGTTTAVAAGTTTVVAAAAAVMTIAVVAAVVAGTMTVAVVAGTKELLYSCRCSPTVRHLSYGHDVQAATPDPARSW